jgi:ribosomal protein L39E
MKKTRMPAAALADIAILEKIALAPGVDCSDHEVDIKILLAQAMKANRREPAECDARENRAVSRRGDPLSDTAPRRAPARAARAARCGKPSSPERIFSAAARKSAPPDLERGEPPSLALRTVIGQTLPMIAES